MLVIDKNDIEKYRYAVAKLVFLRVYEGRYSFIQDVPKSNLILVQRENEKIIASLLGKPKVEIIEDSLKDTKVIIFYQTKKKNYPDSSIKLSEAFDIRFKDAIVKALIAPKYYLEEYKYFEILFNSFLEDIYSTHSIDGTMFKHYSSEIENTDQFNRKDGQISFLAPHLMNDPFDCNCEFDVGGDASSYFRLFCTTPHNDNVLMWSHYSDNHKGYCFEYRKFDVVHEILKSKKFNGILIYGSVDYKDKRTMPIIRKGKKITFTYIHDYIEASFSKSAIWNYEDEFRFVLISDSFNSDAISFKIPIINIFRGCRCSGVNLTNSKGNALPTLNVKKSDTEYKLET